MMPQSPFANLSAMVHQQPGGGMGGAKATPVGWSERKAFAQQQAEGLIGQIEALDQQPGDMRAKAAQAQRLRSELNHWMNQYQESESQEMQEMSMPSIIGGAQTEAAGARQLFGPKKAPTPGGTPAPGGFGPPQPR